MAGFLDKQSTVAEPGFNRWLIPPAALAIHLSIGQVYAFSVFNEPLTRIIGVTESVPEDWKLTTLGWIFSIAIAVLGVTAALGGRWVERVGPRKTMVTAAAAWGGGFLISALGVWVHSVWLLYLGYGVFGGIGLGFAYISPVKTLIRWFPDKPGMATGMAIMGFGGGAMIGSPLAVNLMEFYSGPNSVGVAATFATMGVLYFILMMFGALIVRVPRDGWAPAGYDPSTATNGKLQTDGHVHVDQSLKTPQFWLVWAVLCLNVTAGIGVLGQASVMSQEMVGISASAAAGFVGLLSIFNMAGRFFWASLSDYIGRKATYTTFFVLGMALYAAVPSIASGGIVLLFVLAYLIIMSMYGGGFATVPAYLRDLFGTAHVGAIHGRLLTAWSVAGILGPVLINYLREFQIQAGVAPAQAYSLTMYIMAGLLLVGLVCNLAIGEMQKKHLMAEHELAYE
ncbi:OFA family MFS transporter [Aquisalimonas lutea]|uniref:L-lactate MFS transporter n=1 Tax=Aquisalimonas lutea TaxID=1327750 RepID=UPI0025B43F10|nr:OFA family MFS transporter [Aquisalimonas lutea]MDN3517560.1 OFA family MFS transporter [Aquisalimonas lutea]